MTSVEAIINEGWYEVSRINRRQEKVERRGMLNDASIHKMMFNRRSKRRDEEYETQGVMQ
jgi:hypothetical protein